MEVQESNEQRLPPTPPLAAPTPGPLPMEMQESNKQRLLPPAPPLSMLGATPPAAGTPLVDQVPTLPAPTSGRAAHSGLSHHQWRKMQAAHKGRDTEAHGSTHDKLGTHPCKGRKGRTEHLLKQMNSTIAATIHEEVHKIFESTVSRSEPGQFSSGPSNISQEQDALQSATASSSSKGMVNSTLLQELQRLLQAAAR
jgi:hypothetical protein